MAQISLAVKYRPTTFADVTEQGSVRQILENQLATNEVKHAYLFCGGAGTGKTTCARIFANEINKGQGHPIELDAASNNSVDDVRRVIEQSKTQALDSEYKVFILDEVHMLSTGAWNALLKVLEEPPAKSIFIMATTDPQKIPKTILSRVQRYNFQRISHKGIVKRLDYICLEEFHGTNFSFDAPSYEEALEYIAKIADGGMRDAITMLDKCLAYSTELTIENVVKAIGATDYDTMFELLNSLIDKNTRGVLQVINEVHSSGKDLKLFIKTFTNFVLDICKYSVTESFNFLQIPTIYEGNLKDYKTSDFDRCQDMLRMLVQLNSDIKWETSPKNFIESTLLLDCWEG